MKVFLLVENKAYRQGLMAEHGLSLYVEHRGVNILFDFGQTPDALLNNAKVLGVNLCRANFFVLSHGHYDHSGALLSVGGAIRKKAHLFLGEGAFVGRFRDRDGEEGIGIPFKRKEVEKFFHINEINGQLAPAEGIVIASVPKPKGFSARKRHYYAEKNGSVVIDEFSDEIAMYLTSEKGLVIVTGCSHRGIANIIDWGRRITGMKRVYAVIGGFHLANISEDELLPVIKELKAFKISRLFPMHCVGLNELCLLKRHMKNVELLSCGCCADI